MLHLLPLLGFHSLCSLLLFGYPQNRKILNPVEKSPTQFNPQTRATFTVFVNLFLSLIIKKLLDTLLDSYKDQSLRTFNYILLASLVVILIQSFSLFLNVSNNPT